ncbi:MAG: ketoacyl-ACP synthase III [Saprospiraceae bacterium]
MSYARITAIGSYAPERLADNAYFESIVETSDEWIQSRTGIKKRYFSAENEYTSDLCVAAAKNLAEGYGKDLSDVDMILVASVTPDQIMPSIATQVQFKLGLENTGALDVNAACAGFGYGMVLAQGLIAAGSHKKILVIGGETLSKVTDYSDRTTCVLFGDAAGAVLIEPSDTQCFFSNITGAEGSGGQDLYMTSKHDCINGETVNANGMIHQNGRRVFKWAVTTMPVKIREMLAKANMDIKDIDWLIPHSANMRILEVIANNLEFPMERVLESIVNFGNTSSATIPMALHQGVKNGQVKKGDKMVLMGFGGGLAYAGVVLQWDL